MLNTAADVTVISHIFWPSNWNSVAPMGALTGIRGATVCLQSESMISITGSGGKTMTVCPFIVHKPLIIWERDILSQWGAKLEVDL